MTDVCPTGTFCPPAHGDPGSGVAVGDLSQVLVSGTFDGTMTKGSFCVLRLAGLELLVAFLSLQESLPKNDSQDREHDGR